MSFYLILAEGPGVACGKKDFEKKNFEKNREHIYESLVLLYRFYTVKHETSLT